MKQNLGKKIALPNSQDGLKVKRRRGIWLQKCRDDTWFKGGFGYTAFRSGQLRILPRNVYWEPWSQVSLVVQKLARWGRSKKAAENCEDKEWFAYGMLCMAWREAGADCESSSCLQLMFTRGQYCQLTFYYIRLCAAILYTIVYRQYGEHRHYLHWYQ